jgi:hypothetical protein
MRNILEATVASAEFRALKLKSKKAKLVVDLIKDPDYWAVIFTLLRAIFPALRVLRLADRSEPAMGFLFYYTNKARQAMEISLPELNNLDFFEDDPHGLLQLKHDDDESDEDSNTDDDNSDSSSNSSDSSSVATFDGHTTLGDDILQKWDDRESKLKHDYSVVGESISVLLCFHNGRR